MSYVEFINNENLIIARENNGLDTLSATKKISSSKIDLVFNWENGTSLPTWKQIKKLSKIYGVSELLFFSKSPIQRNKAIPDYRVGNLSEQSTLRVKKLVNTIEIRQRWLENKFKSTGIPKNKVQGTGKELHHPKDLAIFIKRKLDIDFEKIKSISGKNGKKKTLEYLIQKAEETGIFVGKTISYHNLSVEDLRGLFISNPYCPFIILNRKDARAAQIFSFIHELAHCFRNTDAISNSLEFRDKSNNIDPEEIFCNKVAAEFLLPEEELKKNLYNYSDIKEIAIIYKTSEIFTFYRLKSLKKIDVHIQDELEKRILLEMHENLVKKAEQQSKKKPGGTHINNMRDSNGNLFNNYIKSFYYGKDIGYVEASKLLLASPEKI